MFITGEAVTESRCEDIDDGLITLVTNWTMLGTADNGINIGWEEDAILVTGNDDDDVIGRYT